MRSHQMKYESAPRLGCSNKLHKFFRKIWVPDSVCDYIVSGIKGIHGWKDDRIREKMAQELHFTNQPALAELKNNGYLYFDDETINLDAPIKKAKTLFSEKKCGELVESYSGQKPGVLITLMRDSDFIPHRELFDFFISDKITSIACSYFNCVPVLTNIRLWWSPPNDSIKQSQLFHLDGEDKTQLKFFFNIYEVTEETGPFTFLCKKESRKLISKIPKWRAKLDDEKVFKELPTAKLHKLLGPPGKLSVVDTSKCLHYGSRGNRKDRVMIMFQFTRRTAPKIDAPIWSHEISNILKSCNKIQRKVLNFA